MNVYLVHLITGYPILESVSVAFMGSLFFVTVFIMVKKDNEWGNVDFLGFMLQSRADWEYVRKNNGGNVISFS